MNHIYRSIWNEHTDSFVAVSENAKVGGKKMSAGPSIATGARFALKALAASLLLAFGSTSYALPAGGTVAAGSATVTSGNGSMIVNQSSQNAALNWQSFNIGAAEAVRFVQPNSKSVALNRVIGADPSSILGSLSANGKVFLVNPNGILFGKGASVNVGGLVASTRNISDSDFMAGNYKFVGTGDGSILNQGSLNADGGYVALLGAHVSNEGIISARLGTIALAAGNGITLDVVGDGLLNVAVNEGTVNALAQNGGMIQADGGHVLMTAQAAGNLLQTVVNNTGVIQARTIENRDGVIRLLGDMQSGTVNVGGTLDASAPDGGNGGFIETSAAHVKVSDDARITTLATEGNTGLWLIDPTDFTIAGGSGTQTISSIGADKLSSTLANTDVRIETLDSGSESGDIHVNSAVSWSANELTLSAHGDININANLNASATAKLALEFGQGTVAAGNSSKIITTNASVNLPASTSNFTTKQGSDGSVEAYTVITSLGAASSTTTTDLQGMNGNKAINYALGSNINASATSAWNAGAGFAPIGDSGSPFTGTFDGLGHTINGMFIDRPSTNNVGTFGYIGNTAEIRNAGLTGVNIAGFANVGGLVGYNNFGSISNSYATGQVVGGSSYTSGLVGVNKGSISNSYATATVTGNDLGTGGLAGYNIGSISHSYATGQVVGGGHYTGGLVAINRGIISDSYATGTVSGGGHAVGGLAALNGQMAGDSASISNSYATGNVSGAANDVGGLVGENYTDIRNSYATGTVTGSAQDVGGLVGIQYNGSISQTYATGAVNGSNAGGFIGGLVGRKNNGTVNGSYWDSYSTGQTVGVGIGLATGMTAITSDPSQSGAANYAFKKSAYTDFDFTAGTGDWFMVNGSTRPFLQSEYSTTIHNSHQLQLMAMDLAAAYTLASDIDVSETGRAVNSAAPGDASGMWSNAGFGPIGDVSAQFTGTFDGQGHIISNLTINLPGSNYVGLFATNGGLIQNVGLTGGSVTGSSYVGGLVGNNANSNAIISNSYNTGSVSGYSELGGIAGQNWSGAIRNSYATGNVTGTGYDIGGLVGYGHNSATVNNSYATGAVTGNSSVGGLMGSMDKNSVIDKSYATGSVTSSAQYSGGLIGVISSGARVSNSYATGAVDGATKVGGLIGTVSNGTSATNSYATGAVTGVTQVGGLIGLADNVTSASNSYSTGAVTGVTQVGGLIGATGSPAGAAGASNSYWDKQTSGQASSAGGVGATGLDTAEMKTSSSFSGFDLVNTWIVYDAYTNPLLRSFMTALTVTANDASKTYDGAAYSGGNGVTYSVVPNGSLLGSVSYTGSAQGAVNAGSYAITPTGLYSSQQGYLISYVDGALTVNQSDPALEDTVDPNPRIQNAVASAISLMSATPLQSNMADAQLPSSQHETDASMQGGLAGLNLSITGDGIKMPSTCDQATPATTGTDCEKIDR